MANTRVGGSFAPPLTDELLAKYEALAASAPVGPVADAIQTLVTCCKAWWHLPESNGTEASDHPSGMGTIVPLDENTKAELFDHIPWHDEIELIDSRIDTLENGPLRNAAYHLLWHVRELDLDREPITTDKL